MIELSDETYLAINPQGIGGYYGKGATVDDAKANVKAQGGKLDRHIIYRMPDGATEVRVDALGQIEWHWTEGADRDKRPEVVAKRGVN